MKITTQWNGQLQFTATDGVHEVGMDTKPPLGSDSAMTPKQLLLAGLAGCTAMDVVTLLKKHQQPLESLEIETEVVKSSGGYPEVFISGNLLFKLRGAVEAAKAVEAVELSQTRYCGVSAMLSKAFPIRYRIELNGQMIGEGSARF